jgi:hypothetical protein
MTVPVNDGTARHRRVIRVRAPDDKVPALKTYVFIVSTGSDNYCVAIIGVIYRRLNIRTYPKT